MRPSIAYLLLLIFGIYVALKYFKGQQQTTAVKQNAVANPPGVSYYCNLAVTNRPAQALAFDQTNCCATTPVGFAPAFGPTENVPACQLPI